MTQRNAEEVNRINEQLEERSYEFFLNCQDGQGDPMACHSYAEWLAVVDRNYVDAAAMYKLNCEKNNYPASCFNLGRLKLAGKGVDASDEDAIKLFEKSCEGKHAQGCHHVGFMSAKGLGGQKDSNKAIQMYERACNLDDANSCNRVASMYLAGTSDGAIKKDVGKAKTFLERACDANFAPACHNLAVLYKKGESGIPADEKQYEEYKKKTQELVAQAGGMGGVKAA